MLETLLELELVCRLGSRFGSQLDSSIEVEPKLAEERSLESILEWEEMLELEEVPLSIVKNGNQNLIFVVELGCRKLSSWSLNLRSIQIRTV